MSRWRWLRMPAPHMLALGALLFAAVEFQAALFPPKPQLEIPPVRREQAYSDFIQQNARDPSAEEWQQLLDTLVEEELLFRYALSLRMYEDSAAKTRLAQIADFVDAGPGTAASEDELARSAMELGLHESDLVVRRILVDRARRMIRSVVLIQTPSSEQVERFFAEHEDRFVREPRVRISQVTANAFKWPDTKAHTLELRARIDEQALDVAVAMALGDESMAPSSFPLTTARGFESQMGREFASALMTLPVGQWSAPIKSRFGHHLVFVHEREVARAQSLSVVRTRIEQQLLQELADEWLAKRLAEMRAEYEIVIEGRES